MWSSKGFANRVLYRPTDIVQVWNTNKYELKKKKKSIQQEALTNETSPLCADVALRITQKKAMAKQRTKAARMATTTMSATIGSLYLSLSALADPSSLDPAVNRQEGN